jgi:hypothetical protein
MSFFKQVFEVFLINWIDCQRSYTISKYGLNNVKVKTMNSCNILSNHVLVFYHHRHHAHVERGMETN